MPAPQPVQGTYTPAQQSGSTQGTCAPAQGADTPAQQSSSTQGTYSPAQQSGSTQGTYTPVQQSTQGQYVAGQQASQGNNAVPATPAYAAQAPAQAKKPFNTKLLLFGGTVKKYFPPKDSTYSFSSESVLASRSIPRVERVFFPR